ncbi:MAG: SDR family NAD(P)-dependent oxidoreductase [Proteobacteria bacterium]|nr:SDR family NAD(P)-dependent oxidoreductase [Pseudomonadota bacterium]
MSTKFIFISGCSSGIGLDAVRTLKTRGYDVLASCRKPYDVGVLLQQGIDCIQLDLASSESVQSALEQIREHGELYALLNNGAFGVPGAVEDLSRAALQHQFETNVFGTHELTRGCLEMMLPRNEGRIIQISSILGGLCLPMRGAYNASKYALEALSDTLRLELHDTNIKISLIQPGPIESLFRPNALSEFKQHIDTEGSRYRRLYASVESRLSSGKPVPFTLPASAVSEVIIHALEAKKPKIRYRVTRPTQVFLPLKRILPDRWMDKLLLKLGD